MFSISHVNQTDPAAVLIARAAHPLHGDAADLDPLLKIIGNAQYVLIGEASHGTHEFYRARAELTKRLIAERGFTAVAVEADWPDTYRVNRYVRGNTDDTDAEAALSGFRRFPQWMWRNADVLDFVGWLRAHNDSDAPDERQVGFYGLDLYSMHASIAAVLAYLDAADPAAARRARDRYACFDHFGADPQAYGYATTVGNVEPCERDVVAQLLELRASRAAAELRHALPADAHFSAEQNALLVRDAERYYRAMFSGRASAWNLRDTHMADTLDALTHFLSRGSTTPKVIVWAHNSHLGDARATRMGGQGELNLGQLVRERHANNAVLIGMTTYAGTVTAASDWDTPAEHKTVRPALSGSYELLFHDARGDDFILDLRSERALRDALMANRLERAIGVIYRPETERQSHYFDARLAQQFDAVLHYGVTRAVEPMDRSSLSTMDELATTFPSAL